MPSNRQLVCRDEMPRFALVLGAPTRTRRDGEAVWPVGRALRRYIAAITSRCVRTMARVCVVA
jgi:hypothetical protein